MRYNSSCRLLYSLFIFLSIIFIAIIPGIYFGAQYFCHFLQNSTEEIKQSDFIYIVFLISLGAGTYSFYGGQKSNIFTDFFQSFFVIICVILCAFIIFSQPEIGGLTGLIELDKNAVPLDKKLTLFKSTNDPELPWAGVLTGLFFISIFHLSIHQNTVQKVLSAKTGREARIGAIVAGFLKLFISAIAICTGVAAYYFFNQRGIQVDSEIAFSRLTNIFIKPYQWGLIGLITAGIMGGMFSILDSLFHSSATIFTHDFYQRYIDPNATDLKLVSVGRISTMFIVIFCASVTAFTLSPDSNHSTLLNLLEHQNYFLGGLLAVVLLGIMWKGANSYGAMIAIPGGILISYLISASYEYYTLKFIKLKIIFGDQLNDLYVFFISFIFSAGLHILVSTYTKGDPKKSRYTWAQLGYHDTASVSKLKDILLKSLLIFSILAFCASKEILPILLISLIAAAWTWIHFFNSAIQAVQRAKLDSLVNAKEGTTHLFFEDRIWAGLLAATAIFLLYYF